MTTLQNGHAAESLFPLLFIDLQRHWTRYGEGLCEATTTALLPAACSILPTPILPSILHHPWQLGLFVPNHSQAIWFQCFTAWPVQKHFLTSTLHLPQWHVRLLFFVVSNVNMASRLLPSSLRQQIFMFEGYCHPPPQSSLLSAEQPNFCQSFKTANHSYCLPLDPFQIIHIFLKATGVARHPL